MHWPAAAQGRSSEAVAKVLRQPLGFAPGLDLPFTTYSLDPSRLALIEVGYQPVGIRPATRLSSRSWSRAITATEFVPPLVTYSVFSSGESARPLGLLPLNLL